MKTLVLFLVSLAVALGDDIDIKQFAVDTQQFTGAVYNELLKTDGNILVSPFSAETVLALTQSGAVGATGKELRESLFLPNTKEKTESIFKSVLPTIQSEEFVLTTANKIYVENKFEIKEDFQKVARSVYGAEFQNIEFSNTRDAADEINQWVEEETNDKIHDLITPEVLSKDTGVLLVNALYFQGNWSLPFETAATKKAQFFTPNMEIETEMMTVKSRMFNYYDSKDLDAKFLEIPIEGGASMTIVLPNEKTGIKTLEKQISRVLTTPKYEMEYVQVSMPKFKIEATIDFKQILQNMGVHTAFSEMADFSGIAGAPGDLSISQVTQKTYIDVNEVGVEAAAATVVIGKFTSSVTPQATHVFTVDHPFIFYLKVNDIVLFEGKVIDPSY